MKLFGFTIKREKEGEKDTPSFVPRDTDDGAMVVAPGGAYGTYIDLDGTVRSEAQLVNRYREMAQNQEVDSAIDDIINQAIVQDPDVKTVTINLDNTTFSEKIKDKIREEFETILKLYDFNLESYKIFRQWYIDGRLYYHIVIDPSNPKAGIKELRYIDPRKIKKIREVRKSNPDKVSKISLIDFEQEYYIFNPKGFTKNNGNGNAIVQGSSTTEGIRIAKDSIVYVSSGLLDKTHTIVISYLHKAIKPLNNLRSLEDSVVIYRISRAPERRIFYIDVGNLPKIKAEQYMNDIMTKYKNRLVYNAEDGCFAMDTKVSLLDGRTLSIEELATEYNSGKENWVYSVNPDNGEIVPGIITWAGVTRRDAEVMKITLDNGKEIICTPDHNFPVWDKGFVRADELTIGESMIPLYRREKDLKKDYPVGYEQVFNNKTKDWEFTHRLVGNWTKNNSLYSETVYEEEYRNSKKGTIHHIDYNRYNNSPNNLTYMNYKDHWAFHSNVGREWSDEMREKQKASWTFERRQKASEDAKRNYPKKAHLLSRANEKGWNNERSDQRRLDLSISQSIEYPESIINFIKDYLKAGNKRGDIATQLINERSDLINEWIELNSGKAIKQKEFIFSMKDIGRITKMHGYNRWRDFYYSYNKKRETRAEINEHRRKLYAEKKRLNHKVVKIEYLNEKIDVGTITIDGNETYHNYHTFALDVGIFTKNSVRDDRRWQTMLEDFWLPRREGGRGTEISTLPAGQNLDQLEDVKYFQKQLYKSLNIPTARLESEQIFSLGRGAEISRDEDKFADFITRLRLQFSSLFIQALEKQLILKNIITPKEWDDNKQNIKIRYAKNSYYSEIRENEVMNMRLETLDEITDYVGIFFSKRWVQKNVLRMTEDEIEQMNNEILEEIEDNENMKLEKDLSDLRITTQVHQQAQKDGIVIDPNSGNVMPDQLMKPDPTYTRD